MPVTAAEWHQAKPWIDYSDRDIERYVKGLANPQDYDLKAMLEHWVEHGVVIFEGAIDKKLLDLLDEDLDYLVHHNKEFELEIDRRSERMAISSLEKEDLISETSLKFTNIQTISRAAQHLSCSRLVASFLRHIFLDAPVQMQSLLFYKGSQQPLHLDYPYVRNQTQIAKMAASWIPMEDIHEDAGPLAYYCGSHVPEKMPFFDWGDGNIVMDPDASRNPVDFANYLYAEMERLKIAPKIFLPKRGDVLIWHAYLAHEGTPIKNPSLTRKSYVTHYCPLSAVPDWMMKPNALDEGHYFTLNGGYVMDFPWITSSNKLPSYLALS